MKLTKTSCCPCGSAEKYENCCGAFIEGFKQPETPEQLMRSRYTAFSLQKENYILTTWHPRTRPEKLNFEDNQVVWLGLVVNQAKQPTPVSQEAYVEFTASYLENGQICRLHENSKFLPEDGRWYYLNGTCNVRKEKVARNEPCPCGSGKKFKKCCLNL